MNSSQALNIASVFAGIFFLSVPAYAFPTPEAVWVVGGVLLKPALILSPLLLMVWRILEWRLKWVHVRALSNRRFFAVCSIILFGFCMELVDRLTFYEEPPPVSKSGRPLAEGSQLSMDAFETILAKQGSDLQVVDLRAEDAFKKWHIEGSINKPDASRKELQAFFEKSLAPTNVIICYGGERSHSIARYLRTHFENTSIHSVFKGVFQLKLKLPTDTNYIVRNVPPVLANTWLDYGLAEHDSQSRLRVGTRAKPFYPGVEPMSAPPKLAAQMGATLYGLFGGPWAAWCFLLSLNAAVFFTLVYARKRSQILSRKELPSWVEICVISLLTVAVAFPATTFPEFFGLTAQEYPVWGENNFSRLLIGYMILVALPLTWHLEHTGARKQRDFMERVAHRRAGIHQPWRWRLYLNLGPLWAFLAVVYFSVEVNCTGLWSLLFTLWVTLLAEKLAEYLSLKKYGDLKKEDVNAGDSFADHPHLKQAQSEWRRLELENVSYDAQELSATCSGVNGLTHSLFMERLYPRGSQDRALRALGHRTYGMAKPRIRLLRIGRELYRAVHPLLEGFRASRWELSLHRRVFPRLRQLWLRRGAYWLNRHLLPLLEKRVEEVEKAKSFQQKKRVLNRLLKNLEDDFAPFQETIVRLHRIQKDSPAQPQRPLGEQWTQALMDGRYVCAPGFQTHWFSMDWSELTWPLDKPIENSALSGLHARASILVLCLHDMIGHLTWELNKTWGYGEDVYELSRRELLGHSDKPWPGMKDALAHRTQSELPWQDCKPLSLVWPPDSANEVEVVETSISKPAVLAPASHGAQGKIHGGPLVDVEAGSIVVTEQLLAADLPKLRDAKAVYCTRGSLLSHTTLVAREWGLPVFKISVTEKENILAQSAIVFEVDGTWRKPSS